MPNNGVLLNTRRRRNSPRSLVAIESEEANGNEATVTVTVITPVLEEQAVLEGGVEEPDRGVLGRTQVPLATSRINIETGRRMDHLPCL
jgi:hypothetical protein